MKEKLEDIFIYNLNLADKLDIDGEDEIKKLEKTLKKISCLKAVEIRKIH